MSDIKQLQQLLLPRREILKVVISHDDGTVTAVSPSGQQQRLIGNASVDQHVYAEKGRVLGSAPNLPHGVIEV
ncbi:hypothetical protein [Motilimonas cestriensis]|uniref:hypothetical protein n=1 Tax=Motilimonas cestriensis TaxID=2742685 RepID=UPI003DA2AB58